MGAVHVLERLEQLVHDVLLVDLLQDVGPDHCVQVCLHVVKDKVDVLVILSLDHVQQPAGQGPTGERRVAALTPVTGSSWRGRHSCALWC